MSNTRSPKIILMVLLFLLGIISSFSFQNINTPNYVQLIVQDQMGREIADAVISFNFKVLGITDITGYFRFENSGGTLCVSKTSYLPQIIQIPAYWNGKLKVNLRYNDIEHNDSIEYKRRVLLLDSPLKNFDICILSGKGLEYLKTDNNGNFTVKIPSNEDAILYFSDFQKNRLNLYFIPLKLRENDSLLVIKNIDEKKIKVEITETYPFSLELKDKFNSFIFPIKYKNFPVSPYEICLITSSYNLFDKYTPFIYFNFSDKPLFNIISKACDNIRYFNDKELKKILSKINFDFVFPVKNSIVLNYQSFLDTIYDRLDTKVIDSIFLFLTENIVYYYKSNEYLQVEKKMEPYDYLKINEILKKYIDESKKEVYDMELQKYNEILSSLAFADLFDKYNNNIAHLIFKDSLKIPYDFIGENVSLYFELFPKFSYDYLLSSSTLYSSFPYIIININITV
ncbi:MAG: hypothetical protein KBG82_07175 [Spirochaetes bacterium]|nr:hypothetical protein [Spirochaetota bacterium]HOV46761.1 hypothetical protein [Exilispira sp.]